MCRRLLEPEGRNVSEKRMGLCWARGHGRATGGEGGGREVVARARMEAADDARAGDEGGAWVQEEGRRWRWVAVALGGKLGRRLGWWGW